MVRTPCCEKIGLKRGPWTDDEDAILIAYINRYGHGNWRALPQHAGLLRCGKSCRLRWMNYLRPDIKRGNFTREEEGMIINLHEIVGNRWSEIAARLPGRTDNEIKNVWHTHLKKRLNPTNSVEEPKTRKIPPGSKSKAKHVSESAALMQLNMPRTEPNPLIMQPNSTLMHAISEYSNDIGREFPEWSHSESSMTTDTNDGSNITNASIDFSSLEFPEIDESFWNEALSMEICATAPIDSTGIQRDTLNMDSSSTGDDVSFWFRVYKEAGELQDLLEL